MRRLRTQALLLILPLGGCIWVTVPDLALVDPYAPPPAPHYGARTPACPSPAAGALAGAVQGGAAGALAGSLWGEPGRGAAVGAGIGAVAGATGAAAACP